MVTSIVSKENWSQSKYGQERKTRERKRTVKNKTFWKNVWLKYIHVHIIKLLLEVHMKVPQKNPRNLTKCNMRKDKKDYIWE